MATRAEIFKSRQERSKPPMPKTPEGKESRRVRTAALKATIDYIPTKSSRGSERAEEMRGSTPQTRHSRRSG